MPSDKPSNLEAHLGYWLRFVSNHVSHSFASKIETKGVTVAEWVVMREMFDQSPSNPSTIASGLSLTRSAVSKLMDRLIQKELVSREFSGTDRRYQTVKLTTLGKRLVPELASLADDNDAEFFGHLSARQKADLVEILKTIVHQHGWKDQPID